MFDKYPHSSLKKTSSKEPFRLADYLSRKPKRGEWGTIETYSCKHTNVRKIIKRFYLFSPEVACSLSSPLPVTLPIPEKMLNLQKING